MAVGAGTRILGRWCRGRDGENGEGSARQSWEAEARRDNPEVRGRAGGVGRRGKSTLLS
jgi:hypothetical protein